MRSQSIDPRPRRPGWRAGAALVAFTISLAAAPVSEAPLAAASEDSSEPGTELARRWLEARAERDRRQAAEGERAAAPAATRRRRSPGRAGRHPYGRPGPVARTRDKRPGAAEQPTRPRRTGSTATGKPETAGRGNRRPGGTPHPPEASPPAEPEPQSPRNSAPRVYTVRKGDTLSSLARRFYGGTGRWKKIAEANPDLEPDQLQVGQKIRLPRTGNRNGATQQQDAAANGGGERAAEARENAADRSEPENPSNAADQADGRDRSGESTPRTVRVESGDTLSRIAERVYGDPGAWRRILEANEGRIRRPERLRVGLELRIPAESNQAE